MTREEIIAMAREADLPMAWISDAGIVFWEDLERFAALIEQRAAAAEREACAQVCDALSMRSPFVESFPIAAAAIRARGK